MARIYSRSKGDGTHEDMNELAKYLLNHGFAKLESKESGFQESSYALCDYEVHVIRKKRRNITFRELSNCQAELLKTDKNGTFVMNVPKGFGKHYDRRV